MSDFVEVDGSFGEGGGQILRTSLAMSLVTGKPLHIINIRAGRKGPGLMHQHLTSVTAAAEVGRAELSGNFIGSGELRFIPGKLSPGNYTFQVPTAGSCLLVLQTVLPALLTASEPSDLTLEGGTHNPFAPPFDFVAKALLPVVSRMGPEVGITLERAGFYPAGGGRIRVSVRPALKLAGLDLTLRGQVMRQSARAIIANLPKSIAERELSVLRGRLSRERVSYRVEEIKNVRGPGNAVIVEVECEHITEVFVGFGRKGVRAENVAAGVADEVTEYLSAEVPVGKRLADQLLIPMALAGKSRFRTLPLTDHATTNIAILKKFLDVRIEVSDRAGGVKEIEIEKL